MNSDPHESAAWRAFGMLDADEAASFDEAMRQDPALRNAWREMNCLSAAVAATTVAPMAPRIGQLERLQTRLGLNTAKSTNWLAITGWAAAAVLTAILVIDRQPSTAGSTAVVYQPASRTERVPKAVEETSLPETPPEEAVAGVTRDTDPEFPTENGGPVATQESEIRTITKVETKRLIQEIEVLREKLEGAQKRDQKRFEAVPGMSWPIVMTMLPPVLDPKDERQTIAMQEDRPILTNMIADALAGNSLMLSSDPAKRSLSPSAIPVYDAARDTGTLVVTNLPKTTPDNRKFLWVKTETSAPPVLVGELPTSDSTDTDSFDFSLGQTGVVPTAFILTTGIAGKPVPPSAMNTVLLGPR